MATARELSRFLIRQGYRKIRQTGSHLILQHPERRMVIIPVHSGDLPKGLLLRILKDAGFTLQEFQKG